jgi:HEAT repeat protein
MKSPFASSLAILLVLSLGAQGNAQDSKPARGPNRPIAEWIKALKDRDEHPEENGAARRALGPDGPFGNAAVPALIDALDERREPARFAVAEALSDHGPAAVPGLVRALRRPEAAVRAGAAEALGRVRPRPTEAIPALIDALADPTADVRRQAARTLGQIRGPAAKTVPALLTALRDDADEGVRAEAAEALSKFGPKAQDAVPGLAAALKDRDASVREQAAWGLSCIGPAARQAVPALIEALRNSKSSDERTRIAQALGGIGPAAKAAVPSLIDALADSGGYVQRWAAIALGNIGPDARAAVPALMKLAKDRGNPEWYHAMTALGRIGPDAKAAVPKLMAIARDLRAYPPAREAAARAVIKIDPPLAARENMETAHLNIRLGKVPAVRLAPRAGTSEEETKRVRTLVAKLADIKDPDFGLSATVTGHAFAPLPEHSNWEMGLLTGERAKTSDAFRALVEMGPSALPVLLEALQDRTPTKLSVTHNCGIGFMGFNTGLHWNPLNPRETRTLSERQAADDQDDEDGPRARYTVKVGDVCFVAIGQIVGRRYLAVRYQPTAIIVITSPSSDRELRERLRALWSGDEATRRLLDSLLTDYATEGIFNGQSLDGWDEGSSFQIEAAMRLLYYFPAETAPLIAARLKSFHVTSDGAPDWGFRRDVKNGVRTVEFVKAVAWCREPSIKEALADIAKRTDDPEIKKMISARPK